MPRTSCAIDHSLRQSSHADKNINLLFAEMLSCGVMHFFARRTELQHFSRDHDATPRLHRSESVNHGAQRLRIGIVAIVDDGDVTQLENLSALVGRSKRRERANGHRRHHSASQTHAPLRPRR